MVSLLGGRSRSVSWSSFARFVNFFSVTTSEADCSLSRFDVDVFVVCGGNDGFALKVKPSTPLRTVLDNLDSMVVAVG